MILAESCENIFTTWQTEGRIILGFYDKKPRFSLQTPLVSNVTHSCILSKNVHYTNLQAQSST